MKRLILSLGILLLLASACENEQKTREAKPYEFFFSFSEELERLNESEVSLVKYLNDTGEKDTLKLTSPNWEEELKLFIDADINDPRLSSDYELSEVKKGDTLVYSLESKKEEEIYLYEHYYLNKELVKVKILQRKSDVLRSSSYSMNYYPMLGYSVNIFITVPYMIDKKLELKAVFQN